MALNAKTKEFTGSSNRVEQEAMEPGTYPARLVQVIDLGTQEQEPYEGKAKPPSQEIYTTYEFLDEFIKDEDGNDVEDKPRWLSENFVLYNLESELSKSTKRYYAIDPTGKAEGDWGALIGEPVMITIGVKQTKSGKNKGKKYNNIMSTSTVRPKEAAKLPDLKNPGKVFSTDDLDTVDVFMSLPQWLQDKIKNGLGFEGTAMDKAVKAYKKDDSKEEKKEKKAAAQKEAAQKEADDDVPFDVEPKNSDSTNADEDGWT